MRQAIVNFCTQQLLTNDHLGCHPPGNKMYETRFKTRTYNFNPS